MKRCVKLQQHVEANTMLRVRVSDLVYVVTELDKSRKRRVARRLLSR